MTTATVDAKSVVQSFYTNLAGGKPDAAFALFSDDIEWNEAEGNPLADRNPYRGANQIAEGVQRLSQARTWKLVESFAADVARSVLELNQRVLEVEVTVQGIVVYDRRPTLDLTTLNPGNGANEGPIGMTR